MVEKAIDKFISNEDIETLKEMREKILRKLGRLGSEVASSSTYEADVLKPHVLVGSTTEFIYPPQPLSETKEHRLIIPAIDGSRVHIYAQRHDFNEEKVTGYVQVNFGVVEGKGYLGVQSRPDKSDTPASLREAISKIYETAEEGAE